MSNPVTDAVYALPRQQAQDHFGHVLFGGQPVYYRPPTSHMAYGGTPPSSSASGSAAATGTTGIVGGTPIYAGSTGATPPTTSQPVTNPVHCSCTCE